MVQLGDGLVYGERWLTNLVSTLHIQHCRCSPTYRTERGFIMKEDAEGTYKTKHGRSWVPSLFTTFARNAWAPLLGYGSKYGRSLTC